MAWFIWVFIVGLVITIAGIVLLFFTDVDTVLSIVVLGIGVIAAIVSIIFWIKSRSQPKVDEKTEMVKTRFQESYRNLEGTVMANENREAAFKTALITPTPLLGAAAGGLTVSGRNRFDRYIENRNLDLGYV